MLTMIYIRGGFLVMFILALTGDEAFQLLLLFHIGTCLLFSGYFNFILTRLGLVLVYIGKLIPLAIMASLVAIALNGIA